jgi:hypothetical protein
MWLTTAGLADGLRTSASSTDREEHDHNTWALNPT